MATADVAELGLAERGCGETVAAIRERAGRRYASADGPAPV
ncbi:MAG: hypothetical protein AVDCRST_MAG19-685 [uncultured Thermomicrobiales bacterium]|uniref:Uncharacterized protein n=1 Tax=uncultured Thermomicrobiales bacterium TaxID=1645740 RepID=A0A6J4UGN4_9BACT|nr:MAG: hypothetical protein AVDCRST_MAG19-685 [uncultured Thermomicrobiales bacterium]